ncbi:porin [Neorhodopirellula pilleata]|uniref:Porin n=1 Tax=Neorhodopirellula pilleata TaxID=2714738 RepID=A0A5C5ZPS5_9BACT|nr:porin [Neorhodopirellula pilleata]TWT89512.1 hypothetical protein Pla100_54410 [Neorhodopirellula pilleata]
MKSKRVALWLALGGFAATSLGWMGPHTAIASADDSFVSEAIYQPAVDAGRQIQQIGFFQSHSQSSCDDAICGCDGPCECEMQPACGCESPMECGCDAGCDAPAGCLAGGALGCNLGEPFELFGSAGSIAAGGWVQLGYHNKALPLFNSKPDNYQLHQMWLYAEKSIDTSDGFDFGGRLDYVYGTDGPDTQAFGIDNGHWDSGWGTGGQYGHALPQVYGEVGYGDLSVKFGHFFTIIGWEVVAAPDNFFYSHAYTMYNSEPFTHTGALATWNLGDDLTVYGGYTLGWDSGFEDNGDSFLGGVSMAISDNVKITYATVGGRFNENQGDPNGAERGYMHSIVSDVTLTDKLQYIGQSDLLKSEDATGATARDSIGYNNYLIYTMSDCLAVGSRLEWWQNEVAGQDVDLLTLTLGVNYKPHANVLVRPEIRWDWLDGDTNALNLAGVEYLEGNDDEQTTFGIDTIFTF